MSDKLYTRRLAGLGNTLVNATLHEDRVFIEKNFLADFGNVAVSRREAAREAAVMHQLAVHRDATGRAVSNNDFVFDCQVKESSDRTTLLMDTVAGWTITEYRDRWRKGVRPWPDPFPEDTMPWPAYLDRVLEITAESAYAFQRIHQATPGYIHADVKPGNLWVLAGQHPVQRMAGIRLIDFGSAFAPKLLDLQQSPRDLLAAYSHICGTPGFWSLNIKKAGESMRALQEMLDCQMPDEDTENCADTCRRALQALSSADDIYALTATLFWALTGQTVESKSEDSLREILARELHELPGAVCRAVADFIVEELEYCSSAIPGDCDAVFIRELERLQQIAQQHASLHPDTLHLCVNKWWSDWSQKNPVNPQNQIDPQRLPLLFKERPQPEKGGCAQPVIFSPYPFLDASSWKAFSLVGLRGVGKTCFLRHTIDQYLEKSLDAVPLYVPLEQIAADQPDAILHFLAENLLPDQPNGIEALRFSFASSKELRYFLFLDGFRTAQCQPDSPLYNQIQELISFSGVRLILAGRDALPGLPVLYAAPYNNSIFGPGVDAPLIRPLAWRSASPHVHKSLRRLLQTLQAYIPYQIYSALSPESQATITPAQLQTLWFYQQICDSFKCVSQKDFVHDRMYADLRYWLSYTYKSEEKKAEDILHMFTILCYRLFCTGQLCFPAGFCHAFMLEGLDEQILLPLLQLAGLLYKQADFYFLDEDLCALGAALYVSRDFGIEFSLKQNTEMLAADLCKTNTNRGTVPAIRQLMDILAELSPLHPMPQACEAQGTLSPALKALNTYRSTQSVLQRLLTLCLADAQELSFLRQPVFEAWAYEHDGNLSACDLRSLTAMPGTDLTAVLFLSHSGAADLPARLPLPDVALLPLPSVIRWMDWREQYLLLAGEREAVVFTPVHQIRRLAVPENCRRILSAALSPDASLAGVTYTGLVEMFVETKTHAVHYLRFSLATGASMHIYRQQFPVQRMDELRSLHTKEGEWRTSDSKHILSLHEGTITLAPSDQPHLGTSLWKVWPYSAPLPAPPLECGSLRLVLEAPSRAVLHTRACELDEGGGVLLYDVNRSEPLWSIRNRQELKPLLEKYLGEELFDFRVGTFGLLSNGFVFEATFGLVGTAFPSHWLVFCDRNGKIIRHVQQALHYWYELLLYQEDWVRVSLDSFTQQENSPAALLNHQLYLGDRLYFRSDLVPDCVFWVDVKKQKLLGWKSSPLPIETLIEDEGRIIAVLTGGTTGYMVFDPNRRPPATLWERIAGPPLPKSGSVQEGLGIVPLRDLVSEYRRFVPRRRETFVPFVLSPVTMEQAKTFAPPAAPGDLLQPGSFVHNELAAETIPV